MLLGLMPEDFRLPGRLHPLMRFLDIFESRAGVVVWFGCVQR